MTSEPPSSGFPADAPPPGPPRVPVRDVRPRSPWAVWTLGVSILLALAAFTQFSAAIVLPALVLGIVAVVRIKPQVMRGQVMVILSMILSALVGSCTYIMAKSSHDMVAHIGAGVLGALGSAEPDRVDKWIAPAAREAGVPDQVRERFAKVVEAYGPYQGEVVLPSKWVASAAIMTQPTNIEEVATGVGEPWAPRENSLWCRAVFRDAVLHVELYLGTSIKDGLIEAVEGQAENKPSPVLHDLRFFADK